jgi:LmbE family N-acetylglucosaminyl deacetylase
VVFLDGVDGELENGPSMRAALVAVVRRLRPDVVLAHDPWRRYRLHPDHRAAGFIALDALVAARDPHFFPDLGPAPHRPRALLLWEADQPNHVERADARAVATKIDALLCHASQYRSTMGLPPSADATGAEADDFGARVRRQLASHGAVAALPAGEAFHLITDL